MILDEIKKIDSSPGKVKEFGWVMAIFFGLLGCFLFWRGKPSSVIFLGTAAVFGALTLFARPVLKPLQKVWMMFAVLMGWLMSRVILGILFYLVITPIALFLRFTKKDLLDMKLDPSASSYWKHRANEPEARTHCERQF